MCKVVGIHSGGTVGDILSYSGTSSPAFSLACDGSIQLIVNYPALFAAIGITYGGNGTTNFQLPNSQGVFFRGAGTQSIGGLTYTGTQGTSQNDTTKKNGLSVSSTGTINQINNVPNGGGGFAYSQTSNAGTSSTGVTISTSLGTGDAETRPANITVKYCIVYK